MSRKKINMNEEKDQPLALIIEDDVHLARLFATALEDVGLSAKIISNGRLAQAELESANPYLILLDLHLPYVSGEDLLLQIKRQPHLKETPVLIVTADALLAEKLQDEVALVLLKPISFIQLRDLVSRLVRSKIVPSPKTVQIPTE